MEKLKRRYALYEQALGALKDGIGLLENAPQQENFNQKNIPLFQDAIVRRFEFCFELAWKFLKEYLEVEYGVLVSSPKKVFIEYRAHGIIQEKEEVLLMHIVDVCNATTYEYNEIIAGNVSKAICENYYGLIQEVIEKIKR